MPGTTLTDTYTWGTDLSGTMQGAGGVGGLLAVTHEDQAGDPVFYPAYDGNGNVSEYVNASESVEEHFEYDPSGRLVANSDTGGDFSIRFSSKYEDGELGLVYYGFRYYDPVIGRWINRDPIEEIGGLNIYGFVDNVGINAFDILGQKPCEDCEGNYDESVDCEWTGSIKPDRITGATYRGLWAHKINRKKNPTHAVVHWDSICDEEREVDQYKDAKNPSGKAGVRLLTNGANMSIHTRFFTSALLRGNYNWEWNQKRQEALDKSSADFCCCKDM